MKKICVYTCITGNYDQVKELLFIEKEIDYYLFTNNHDIKSRTWNVVYIEDSTLSNLQLSRKIKMLGYPEITDQYDLTVWMDGSVIIMKSIRDFIEKECKFDKYPMVGFKHSERDCIYDEAIASVKYHKQNKKDAEAVIKNLEKNNYPRHNGLIEATILFRKNKDKKVQDTMKLWFELFLKYPSRDQLSFNFAAYQTGLEVQYLEMNVFNNETFQSTLHTGLKQIKKYRIYFGNEDVQYDFKYDVQGEWLQDEDGIYKIQCKVLRNTNKIIFEPDMFIIGIYYNKFKVIGAPVESITPVGIAEINNIKIFTNFRPKFIINGDFKKNQVIEISGDFKIATEEDWQNLLLQYQYITSNRINEYNNQLNELEKEKNRIQNSYNNQTIDLENILNSKGWKFLEKLRKIKRW